MLGNRLNRLQKIRAFPFAPGGQGTIGNLQRHIRHDKLFVKEQLYPEPVTGRARAQGGVEGKQARFDFRNSKAGHRAGELLRERNALRLHSLCPLFASGGCYLQHSDTVGKV